MVRPREKPPGDNLVHTSESLDHHITTSFVWLPDTRLTTLKTEYWRLSCPEWGIPDTWRCMGAMGILERNLTARTVTNGVIPTKKGAFRGRMHFRSRRLLAENIGAWTEDGGGLTDFLRRLAPS